MAKTEDVRFLVESVGVEEDACCEDVLSLWRRLAANPRVRPDARSVAEAVQKKKHRVSKTFSIQLFCLPYLKAKGDH